MIMVLATPTPPTSSAMPPRPSSRLLNAPSVAAFARSADDGSVTFTFCGFRGSTVAAITFRTSCTTASSDRSYTDVGWPSKPSSRFAPSQPTSAERSISGARGSGARMPVTVK